MLKFKEIDLKAAPGDLEEQVLKYWEKDNVVKRSVSEKEGAPPFVFYEGPPTANGKPGIHHVLARTLKDVVCRYMTMQGHQVKRKGGWDTHGLPVEIEVEKQLGLSSKQDIEAYGIEAFNEQCRASVWTYEEHWRKLTERIAYWLDMDDPYVTLDNRYIESVWWILQRFFEAGLIYEGHKIMPYCPRCGTPLASHEVSLGYKEEDIESIYVKMKLKGTQNEYFLLWTTTPWTLPSNVALCVHPELDYVKVKVDNEGRIEYYLLVKERLEAIFNNVEYQVVGEMKGKDLEGSEYEQLLPFIEVDKRAFYVVCADFVTTSDGTGIVHIAPAFGEDDYQLGVKYDLPLRQPVDKEGRFTDEITPWAGMFVKEADPEITRYIRDMGMLFHMEGITHSYPHCWRCDTPLLYYARKSWYIKTTAYKERLIARNKEINWFPAYVGEGRFGNWLENLIDWSLSRDRYWGTPLNIWKCEDCDELVSIGSRQELADRSVHPLNPEEIELHRPYVDDIVIKCKCGQDMQRTPEVIDCWFESGAMPYAQHHYPFENKENFHELFPADYICEGIDQTRGWFYTLLAISTFLFDKPAFKNVVVNDLILDKNGQKMSKSRGNTVDPWELINKHGADATRWYMLAVSPPWTPTRFDEDGVREVYSKFLGTLKNVYSFFTMYANVDDIDPTTYHVPYKERQEIDRWVLSRLNSLSKYVNECMAVFEFTRATRAIQEFVVDEVSNWYVRRSRGRFWASENTADKEAAYLTLHEVLVTVVKLMAPFAPFISEEIYRSLTHSKQDSVHLGEYPLGDQSLIDTKLEKQMKLTMDIVSLGRACRNRVQIKVRQPLDKIMVDGRNQNLLQPMEDLVKEELNVKNIDYITDVDRYVSYEIKPNFRVLGPKYGKLLRAISSQLSAVNGAEFVTTLRTEGQIILEVEGTEVPLSADDVELRVHEREGYTVERNSNNFVILDTEMTRDLILEGLTREVISKIQTMRKDNGFEITDNIKVAYVADSDVGESLLRHHEYIKDETLAVELVPVAEATDVFVAWDINGHKTYIHIERI